MITTISINKHETIEYNQLFDPKYEIGVRLQDKEIAFPEHYHDYIEIVCQLDGTSTQIIAGKSIELNKNELIIINPCQSHQNLATSTNVLNLIISEKFLTNLIIEGAFDDDIIALKSDLTDNVHKTKYLIDKHTTAILQELFYNYKNPNNMYYLLQKSLLTCFLIDFWNKTKFSVVPQKSDDHDLISYIKNNITTASLNEYAHLCNYSPSLLSQKIKSEYNITFIEILQEMRLKQAINLIISSNKSIESIVNEVGYTNRTHFYTLFKSKFNQTPNQYKKKHCINKMNIKNDND